MNLSVNTRYAIRLLFELHTPNRPISSALLAERTGISLKTIEKIQATLKENGLTAGMVGPKGGIFLLHPLTEISLGKILSIFEDGIQFKVCCGDKANECPNQESCEFSLAWEQISKLVQNEIDKIFLWNIAQKYLKANESCQK